jgi:hypothetical protein
MITCKPIISVSASVFRSAFIFSNLALVVSRELSSSGRDRCEGLQEHGRSEG